MKISYRKLRLDDLWSTWKGSTPYSNGRIEIWVDFNRMLKPFIKARVSGYDCKSFNFSKSGLQKAKDYVARCLRDDDI